jgi:hypothetical protein
VDIGLEDAGEWWYNVQTQQVEHGLGAPNAERMGPYATEQEAAHAMELVRERNEAWDAEDEDEDD